MLSIRTLAELDTLDRGLNQKNTGNVYRTCYRTLKLEWLLGYELRGAARHRYFVSVVMMAPHDEKISMIQLLKNTVRASDQFFTVEGESAVLMAHTARDEARKAVERYRNRCNGEVDVRYSIASYPDDGGAVADILKTAEQRLIQAKRAGFGAIVSGGQNSQNA